MEVAVLHGDHSYYKFPQYAELYHGIPAQEAHEWEQSNV